MKHSATLTVLFVALQFTTAAQEPQPFVREVFDRVTSAQVSSTLPWPPHFRVESDDAPNAFAFIVADSGQIVPHIVVTTGLLTHVIDGSPDRLAAVIAHEVSHLQLGHCDASPGRTTTFRRVTFGREKELEADKTRTVWQLDRVYRTRNYIVHTGRTPLAASALVVLLHDFVDVTLGVVVGGLLAEATSTTVVM